MHLADTFIQSDLHCIQVTVLHFISSQKKNIYISSVSVDTILFNFIKNILIFVLKMNEDLTDLERHEGE